MEHLLRDPERRARMGAAGREHVAEAFDPAANVAALVRLFENAAGGME
jgi:hypothetical protein